jgi:hypothetical protein
MGTIGGKVGGGAALVAGMLGFPPLMFWNFYGDGTADPRRVEGEGIAFLIVPGSVAAVAAAVGSGVRFVVDRMAGPVK